MSTAGQRIEFSNVMKHMGFADVSFQMRNFGIKVPSFRKKISNDLWEAGEMTQWLR